MSGFAFFVGGGVIVTYLALEPNRWLAIGLAAFGLAMQWRAIVHAGAEDPVELKKAREGSRR